MLSRYGSFKPDIIVEATNACDQSCRGCYAANSLVAKEAKITSSSYIDLTLLISVLKEIPGPIDTLGIRGGEPTLHPQLPELFDVTKNHTKEIFLETHGRWITRPLSKYSELILNACASAKVIVKVSFDKMHRTSASELDEVVTTLKLFELDYRVAITEPTKDEFLKTRVTCGFIPDSKIIFQAKARSVSELITPKYGVVHTDGTRSENLSSKWKSHAQLKTEVRSVV